MAYKTTGLYDDYQKYWGTPDGSRDWAGGTLNKTGDSAVWTPGENTTMASSNPLTFQKDTGKQTLYNWAMQKGDLYDQWHSNYGQAGISSLLDGIPGYTPSDNNGGNSEGAAEYSDNQQYGNGNNNTGNSSNNTGQVTMPGMSNENVPGWINQLAQGIPGWFDAYNGLKGLPGQIDNWTNESLKRQRVTADNVAQLFDSINEQRAGSGIMGGTEDANIKAQYMANMTNAINDNKSTIMNNANTMKAQAISAMPGAAQYPISAMTSLYGTNASDQTSWANIAAQLLNGGY